MISKHIFSITLTLALLLGAGTSIVHAAPSVYYVNASGGSDSNDGLAWLSAFATPQKALSVATGGDKIWIAQGVYYPDEGPGQTDNDRAASFGLKNGVSFYGGFDGTETARTQRDWTAHPTILSGDIGKDDINTDDNFVAETTTDIQGSNSYHVITNNMDVDIPVVLDGFTITAGQANVTGQHVGGGLYVNWCNINIAYNNLIISGNMADSGGGIYHACGISTFTDVTFSGNLATTGGGGASIGGNATLENVLFQGNSTCGSGGGLNVDLASSPILNDVIFFQNTAGRWGGGMLCGFQNDPTLANVIFKENSAGWGGGGMYNASSSPHLTNVLFVNNEADLGGGVYNSTYSNPEFINVVFFDNSAITSGGAVYNWASTGNSVIPVFVNSILWGNTSPEGPQIYNNINGTPILSYSDIQGSGGSGAGWDSLLGTDSGGNIDSNPLFVSPATADLHLQSSSPTIDSGMNTGCPATDLEGNSRPQDGNGDNLATCDMGAYEYPDTTAPTIVTINRANPNPTNTATVGFTITFSESVTGVDTADFSLTKTGAIAGESVDTVSGGPTVYTVTVNTGSGDGTLRLDVTDDDTIVDLALNPLGSAGVGNGDFTTGEVYDIDKTAPTVTMTSLASDPTNATPISVTVQFSETVTGFSISDIIPGNGTVSSFVAVNGDTYTFDLTPSAQGPVTADIAAAVASDSAGNGNTIAAQFSRTYDSVAPTVTMTSLTSDPTNATPISVTVQFNETVTGFSAGDILPSNGTVSNFMAMDGDTYTFDLIPSGQG
ncbi:MAG: hypothetical protein KKD28_15380, partial [Chloroflexi bacterium]|nr:hypothetical protein [Chloroflexota bacterium]